MSYHFLDTLVTHGDRGRRGAIFLSFLSSASVCLSPSLSAAVSSASVHLRPTVWGPWGASPTPPAPRSFCLRGRRRGGPRAAWPMCSELPVNAPGGGGHRVAWQGACLTNLL